MKSLAKLSIVVVVAAVLALLVAQLAREGADAAGAEAPAAPLEAIAAPLASAETSGREPTAAAELAAPALETPSAVRTLRGRLSVAGYDRRIGEANVRLSLRVTNAAHEPSRELTLDFDGPSFELTASPDETRVLVDAIRIDAWSADPLEPELALDAGGELLIDARLSDGVVLHVVDAGNRAELDGVTIVASPQWTSIGESLLLGAVQVPTREMQAEPLLADVASPVVLPQSATTSALWVTAADHAWRRVEIAGGRGERTIALEPSCALLVRLRASEPPTCNLSLSVAEALTESPLAFETLGRTLPDELRIDKLPPGECRATIECMKGRTGERVAAANLMLSAGQATTWEVRWTDAADFGRLRIAVDASSDPAPVGSHVPKPNYELTRVRPDGSLDWYVRREQAMKREGEGESYTADVDKLESGPYELAISPWGFVRRVEIVAGIESAVELDTARRVEVRVRVVDALTRAPLDATRMAYGAIVDGQRSTSLFAAKLDDSDTVWIVLTEPGLVDFAVAADGYASQRRSLAISSAGQELTFELRATKDLPVTLTVKQGETVIPFAGEEWIRVKLESGPPGGSVTKHEFRTTGLSTASTSCVMRVSVPGTYVLRVPPSLVGGASDRLVSVDVADPQGASVELQRVD